MHVYAIQGLRSVSRGNRVAGTRRCLQSAVQAGGLVHAWLTEHELLQKVVAALGIMKCAAGQFLMPKVKVCGIHT